MGQLYYLFASSAARHSGGVTCTEGMKLLADTLHPHGVKITWLVSPESARISADILTKWHDDFGDDVALCADITAGDLAGKKAQWVEQRDAVRQTLSWAEVTVAASGHTDPDTALILAELGFEGLWGFCWEQIEVDDITDRGCPWGLYYLDPEQRLRPASDRGLVAMEWTARDLLKSFHSGNPCLYSTDPNDVARGGICSWEAIDYWRGMGDNYRRNTRYNDHIFLLQHQEAHEMEWNEQSRCYSPEDAREAAVMLDAFVAHLKPDATMLTLPEAVRLYRETHTETASSYMLWEDTPHPPYNPAYNWSTPVGPWPKTFLFYDRQAQMIFIEGRVEPVCIRNYALPLERGRYFAEPDIPRVRLIHDTRHHWSRDIELAVTAPRAMPFGIALWDDYSLYLIDEAPGLIEGKILSPELLFLRYDLEAGENRFRITLPGK